jgi:hypothetical protein
MSMSLTKKSVDAVGATSPKISPSSVVDIAYYNRPSSDGNWTTKTLYTCPSTAIYAKIYFNWSGHNNNTSDPDNRYTQLINTTTTGYQYNIKVGNDVVVRSPTEGGTQTLAINRLFRSSVAPYQYPTIEDNDALITYEGTAQPGIILKGSRLILNPGEKFQLLSGNSANSSYAHVFAQIHVFT